MPQCLVDFFVDDKGVGLLGLGLDNLNGLTGLEVPDVRDLELEQVSGPDAVVDAHSEEKQVPWLVGEQCLDGLDVFNVSDGMNEYLGTGFGVVEVGHGNYP